MASDTATTNPASLIRLSIPKLQGHANYMGWRRDMRTVLSNQRLWTHTTDDPPPEPLFSYREPDLTDIQEAYPNITRAQQGNRLREAINLYKQRKAWDAAEVKAGEIMISSITQPVLSRIDGHAGSTKQIWEALQREYMGSNFILADTELERLHASRYDEFGSATAYVQHIKTLVDLLKDMGIVIPDYEHSHILLKGLGEAFRDVIISLRGDTRAGEPKVLGERIISAENNIQKEQRAALPSANAVRGPRGTRTKKCSHCGSLNHDDNECWIKHPHLRPRRRKRGKKTSPASS